MSWLFKISQSNADQPGRRVWPTTYCTPYVGNWVLTFFSFSCLELILQHRKKKRSGAMNKMGFNAKMQVRSGVNLL